jgi:tRNA(adenine34) deaminase
MNDEQYLRLAIAEARLAQQHGEVPVGAVIVHNGEVLATGRNRVIVDSDPTAHAEIVALRAGGQALGNYRLPDCDLYVTLEPCAMCASAIMHARIRRLIFATPDPKAGACGSVLAVLNHPQLNHKVDLTSGLLADECSGMLTGFFRARRKG